MTDLKGAGTGWTVAAAAANEQVLDNNHAWEVFFAYGGLDTPVHPIVFAGEPDSNPTDLRAYLVHKQGDGDEIAMDAETTLERCVFCRQPFGTKYEDAFFGTIVVQRNPRNRYYCNQCDFFIRICPGRATLVMPVLVADVKRSRQIREEVGDLSEYAGLLLLFQSRVAAEIQKRMGFILNTVGDSVVAVWPSGFIPQETRDRLGWGSQHPAGVAAALTIETAQALANMAPKDFDGVDLPFRGAVDTTEMAIFAVTPGDPDAVTGFETLADEDAGPILPELAASELPTGPAAIDIAGEAVEFASDLASHEEAPAGVMYITKRTDNEAGGDTSGFDYETVAGDEPTRRLD